MGGCSHAIYSKGRTHDDGRVRGIRQPGNVPGFKYNVDTAELHVDPERRCRVSGLQLYLSDTVKVAYLRVMFA